MVYGRQARGPADLIWPATPRVKVPRFQCSTGYVLWLQNRLRCAERYARQNLKSAAIRMKRYYDMKSAKPPKIGEYCYRHIPPSNKGIPRFIGPGKITSKLSDIHVLWQANLDAKPIRLNLNNIKAYVSTRVPANWAESTQKPPPVRRKAASPTLKSSESDTDTSEVGPESPGEDLQSEPDLHQVPDSEEHSSRPDHSASTSSEDEPSDVRPRRSRRAHKPVDRLDL